MKKLMFRLIQFTWGLPQNLLGLILFLIYHRCRRETFRCAKITYWKSDGGLSLGMFIFLPDDVEEGKRLDFFRYHEYGHSIQSLILGPLYLFIVGIPSFIWANSRKLRRMRLDRNKGYYTFYTEKWANSIFKHYIKDR
ncbi:MAG: hypothetical protein IKI62_02900 [Clostridia bacterium]|nr:hypothetical protein [Clostridia bacterium]